MCLFASPAIGKDRLPRKHNDPNSRVDRSARSSVDVNLG